MNEDGRVRQEESSAVSAGVVQPSQWADGEWEIFLYDGTSTIRLTNNDSHDHSVQISDNGYLVWQGKPDGYFTSWEIFLYDGTSITQLTNNDCSDTDPQINNNGYVLWRGCDGSDYEIFPANPSCTDHDGAGYTHYLPMRFSEIIKLTWDEVDMEKGFIRLPAERTKPKTARPVYLHPRVMEMLQSLPRGLHTRRVFLREGHPFYELDN